MTIASTSAQEGVRSRGRRAVGFGRELDAGGSPSDPATLRLTGEFELVVAGRSLAIPHAAERVLAYLALAGRSVARPRIAGSLWPTSSAQRAAKSLRNVLWRLHGDGLNLVMAQYDRLSLNPEVRTDFSELETLAYRLIEEPKPETLARLPLLIARAELLPDWGDEWLVSDRERYRLTRLQALESAAHALVSTRKLRQALMAASAAIEADPLRESPRRAAVQVQIAQGNVTEAIREYCEYRALLRDTFGLVPTRALNDLLKPWWNPEETLP
ncbi:hypothetical protein ERC79_10640 [Rhodococcus sp. ABRD24]|uniref:AfsR/SARP family transcriptional regulator n=1 Tax=Rhodococcus sp. ABRD24 TaxID=2507582 RepID=UPI0010387F44|nr:BTAD domain-containing putative transcriptional regulator [Rhodococcus sp. ABRD24]QBJ96373.1 hypothetical protein ERC79_10640 [Rhodococcus sp. ABRD24]